MIYIVIAVHNRLTATLECLQSITRQTYRDFKVILVDDGSTDDTSQTIAQQYPDTTILHGDGQLWWTGAMAKGVTHVLPLAGDTDYLLSLNNDVTFESNYLEHLLQTSQQHDQAVVGSLCQDVLPPHAILDAGITMNWYKYQYGQVAYDATKSVAAGVDTISGRGVLIPVSVLKRIGNFAYQSLPHYGADYEFGFRAKAAGVPLVVDYGAVVYLKNDLTGFRPTARVLSYRDEWRRLFSIKSPANVIVHLKIIWKHCPRLGLKLFDICYVIAGNLFIASKNTLLYTLQLCGLRKFSS